MRAWLMKANSIALMSNFCHSVIGLSSDQERK